MGWLWKIVDKMFGDDLVVKASNYGVFSNTEIGDYPVVEAAAKGHFEVLRYLLDKGANINANVKGVSALNSALLKNQYEIAKYLLNNKANARIIVSELNTTSLDILFSKDIDILKDNKSQILEIAKLLIAGGNDINKKNSYGYNPLGIVCRKKASEFFEFLVQKGADLEIEINGEKIRDICKRNGIEFKKE